MDAQPLSLLHLTDLHYGSDVDLSDAKITTPNAVKETPFWHLKSLLESLVDVVKLDAIAITGDITNRGAAKGLTDFSQEALPSLQKLVNSRKAICIVPGNHDVVWDLDPKMQNYFSQKFDAFIQMSRAAQATTCLFPDKSASLDSNSLVFEESIPIFVDRKRGFLVMCVNSSMRCGERDFELHPAFTDLCAIRDFAASIPDSPETAKWREKIEDVLKMTGKRRLSDICQVTVSQLTTLQTNLDQVRKKLGDDDWFSLVKIAVLHHHVTPFESQQTEHKPFDIMNDAAQLLGLFAEYGFDIALTGHKHHSYVQPVLLRDREMLVVGGSTVGGQPASGITPGVRYLSIDVNDRRPFLRIIDLPCNKLVNARNLLAAGRASARVYPIVRSHRTSHRLWMFPSRVSATIEKTLTRDIIRRDVQYEIRVGPPQRKQQGLTLAVKLSFTIANLGEQSTTTHATYPFEKEGMGRIKSVRIEGKKQDLVLEKLVTNAGLRIEMELASKAEKRVIIDAEEFVEAQGSMVLVNFCPAEGMTVKGKTEFKSILVGVEKIGPHVVEHKPARDGRSFRISTGDGLMPFQGFRFIWRRKNGTH